MIRTALGLLAAMCAAPAAVVVLFAALFYFQAGWFAGQDTAAVVERTRLYALMSGPVALFVTLAFGGPVAHRLAHIGYMSWWRHALLGMALGATPFLIFDGYNVVTRLLLDMRPAPNLQTYVSMARWAGLGAWCGLWSALAYWAVAVRERAR